MTLLSPLGLLALLAVPAVVILHLYRRRLGERRVAGLFLFTGERLVAAAGRQRTRLLNTPSLWLECLAAIALALWLAGLSFGDARAQHVVFVLDDSASMGVGEARSKALAAVRERVAGLSGSDRVTILRTGPRPVVLLGPRALPVAVVAALSSYQPVQTHHDVLPTLDLARELAVGEGQVVFCTDEEPPPGCADVTVLTFGEAAPNCAILSADRWRRDDGDGEELRVTIAGFGAVAATEVAVFAGEQALQRRPVELQDGRAEVALRLPAGVEALRVQLAGDVMALDDVAWLLPTPERTVAVCDLLTAEQRAQLQLARLFAALRGHRYEADPRQAQLVLTGKPGQLSPGQTEFVVAAGDGEREAWRGPFVIDRAHDWLLGVKLEGVVWLAGPRALPGQVLVAAGRQALVSEEFLEVGRRLWLNLDASTGNLMRSPDWPVLFANLLDAARREVPGVEEPNVRIGDEARYRRSLLALASDSQLWLEGPDGIRHEGGAGRTVGFVLEQPGVHRVTGRDGVLLGRFAARFVDASESDLRGRCTLVRSRVEPATNEMRGALRDTSFPQRVLAMLLFLLVLGDWWLLARRSP